MMIFVKLPSTRRDPCASFISLGAHEKFNDKLIRISVCAKRTESLEGAFGKGSASSVYRFQVQSE